MSTITTASRQWATRPDDERFTSLTSMLDHYRAQRAASDTRVVSGQRLRVAPHPKDPTAGLVLTAPAGPKKSGVPALAALPNNWSFGQLASRAGVPGDYARKIPADLAARCINHGLAARETDDELALLVTQHEGQEATIRAVLSDSYGRVWNEELTAALVDKFGDGLSGEFRVPGEFGKQVAITKQNTTIYGGDRDMFVFLADEERRIEVPGRRPGKHGGLARGFFCWNSEVGSQSIGAAFFLFDYVCSNRIVWGAEGYREIRVRHTSGAPDRWLEQVAPQLVAYSESSAAPIQERIRLAQARKLGEGEAETLIRRKFGLLLKQYEAIVEAHQTEEDRPIETIWDLQVGVTAHAKTIEHQDRRVAMERVGGRILDLVAA